MTWYPPAPPLMEPSPECVVKGCEQKALQGGDRCPSHERVISGSPQQGHGQ